MRAVTGNTQGLSPKNLRNLERISHQRVGAKAWLSEGLARHLAQASHTTGRQIGVLINRRGQITEVFVGDAVRIYLPDVGRQRGGESHLRGLRVVHTAFGDAALVDEDVADLRALRLDAVVVLGVLPTGLPGAVGYATLVPQKSQEAMEVRKLWARTVSALAEDFAETIEAIEDEMGRKASSAASLSQGPRAVVVGVYRHRSTMQWRQDELVELAATAGIQVIRREYQLRGKMDPRFVVGRGKLESLTLLCLDLGVEWLIFDHDLSPTQARGIAASTDLKLLDRTQLILDIFAQHARSRDGKLQVELAQLRYRLPRLTDMDAGLSRLGGGIGGRGPGETKLEVNRRRSRDRIGKLEKEIERLGSGRKLRRRKRQKGGVPVISIVGYTNAGKSTLLNALTQSSVGVADKLFATLDPTSRRMRFPFEREAVLTDTVGFIRDLPEDLAKAFKATLEELEMADMLIHLVDGSDEARDEKEAAVKALLEEMGLSGIPTLVVENKADKMDGFVSPSSIGAKETKAEAWEAEDGALAEKIAANAEKPDTEPSKNLSQQGILRISAHLGIGLKHLVAEIGRYLWQAELELPKPDWQMADGHENAD